MFVYYLMYAVPVIGVLFNFHFSPRLKKQIWLLVGILFVVLIGLRHEVGGDWFAYLDYYEWAKYLPFEEAIFLNDPGYMFINWLSGQLGGGIYLVNAACAAICVWGLFLLAQRQPLPWVAVAIAVPYLLMVVAMGYTRQSVAMGLASAAFVALTDRRLVRFFLLSMLAVSFHKTAIILFVLPFFVESKNRLTLALGSILFGAIFFMLFVVDKFEGMWVSYVENQMVSEGGYLRIFMNLVAALLIIFFGNKIFAFDDGRIWRPIAVFSLVLFPIHEFASTVADRMALYVACIQMVAFSRIHLLFSDRAFRTLVICLVLLIYWLVQWVWLNFGLHAPYWLPYKMYPWVE